jgi:hypothetical protein
VSRAAGCGRRAPGDLIIQGLVVSFRDCASTLASAGDALGIERCRCRALSLLDEFEARLHPDERSRLRYLLAEARAEIRSHPATVTSIGRSA